MAVLESLLRVVWEKFTDVADMIAALLDPVFYVII
jgi:hypothetical protein